MSHHVVASVNVPTVDAALAAFRGLPAETTLVEVRLDGLWQDVPDPDAAADAILALVEAAPRPLVATLRPTWEGGRFKGPEAARLNLLAAARRCGFTHLDVELPEMAPPGFLHLLQKEAPDSILSRHLAVAPDCRDSALRPLLALQDGGGLYDKLAYPSGSFVDDLRAIEAVRIHAQRNGKPAVSTLGSPDGARLRALLAVVGNCATYGHAPGSPPAVAGQPALADTVAAWRHWGVPPEELSDGASPPRPWLAVLGDPVGGSLSPRLHNASFRAKGVPHRYVALTVPHSPSALRLVLTVGARLGLAGASVTYPHKTNAARMAAGDAVVKATGAANQLRFTEGGAEATNTDATALRRLLAPHVRPGTRGVVLGAGGAARAALWALKELGADAAFTSRDPERARLASHLGQWVPWQERGGLRADAWVQATTVGLRPGEPSPATPHGARVAVELNYKGGPTAFQEEARKAGATVLDGRAVVLEQAVDAQRFWLGAEPDRQAMEAALPPAAAQAVALP